jgi:hypothetical protein
MRPDDGLVDDHVLEVRVIGQGVEKTLPDTALRPARETPEGAVPVTEHRRQIAPRRGGSGDPKHGFHEQTVVAGRDAAVGRLALAGAARSAPTDGRSAPDERPSPFKPPSEKQLESQNQRRVNPLIVHAT